MSVLAYIGLVFVPALYFALLAAVFERLGNFFDSGIFKASEGIGILNFIFFGVAGCAAPVFLLRTISGMSVVETDDQSGFLTLTIFVMGFAVLMGIFISVRHAIVKKRYVIFIWASIIALIENVLGLLVKPWSTVTLAVYIILLVACVGSLVAAIYLFFREIDRQPHPPLPV